MIFFINFFSLIFYTQFLFRVRVRVSIRIGFALGFTLGLLLRLRTAGHLDFFTIWPAAGQIITSIIILSHTFVVSYMQAFSFDACDRTRQHMRKPICACYLSHAWKVIFSWKGLVPLDILLSILCFCLRAPSLNNAVYVNSVSQALVTTAWTPPKTVGQFYRAFLGRFSVFFENYPSLYCILF